MCYFFMNLNYEYILGYKYFQLVSTIIGQRKLTNSLSDKKKFILLPKPRKIYIVNAVQSYSI